MVLFLSLKISVILDNRFSYLSQLNCLEVDSNFRSKKGRIFPHIF